MDIRRHTKNDFIKSVKISLLMFIPTLLILAAFDINFQFTSLGTAIHKIIWTPALVIDTNPPGAIIEILKNNVDIIVRDGYRSVTPTNITNIPQGNYMLRLSHKEHGQIERKLIVAGKISNPLNITIPNSAYDNGVYTISFETGLTITSEPEGADVFINGKNIGPTPAEIKLELGEYAVALQTPGYLSWKETITLPMKNANELAIILEQLPETPQAEENK